MTGWAGAHHVAICRRLVAVPDRNVVPAGACRFRVWLSA